MRLAERSWPDVAGADPPLLAVPVGSCEQHGPHLPTATDTIVAEALATALAERMAGVVVAPTIAEVAEFAARGETMPQKSTYFYPKLTSGLLLFPL